MSDQLLSPQHTRRGAQFGAAATDSVSSAATATSQGRGRGGGASRLRAASSGNRGGRGLSAAAAGFSPAPVDEQNHATIVDGGSPRNDAHADDTQVAGSPGTRADDSFGDSSTAAAAGATSSQQDVPAVGDQALPAAQATGVEAFALPAHLRSALAAESEAIMLETLDAIQGGDGRPAIAIFQEKTAAKEAAAKSSAAKETDDDKLIRLRAEQQASAEALSNFEKEKAAKNGNSSRKSALLVQNLRTDASVAHVVSPLHNIRGIDTYIWCIHTCDIVCIRTVRAHADHNLINAVRSR
eukprot:COSAG03_NODE_2698_length_2517_cov_119.031431_3_plen_297_part_00